MKLLFISLIVLLIGTETPKTKSFKPVVVLELFTSQGCSSCPPADALLQEIKKKYSSSEVIALSFHVDYWNYIGWNDPFSKAEYGDLQRDYGQKFNNSSIYTPQMVVNGKEHFVGSNEQILTSKIKSYSLKNVENSVIITNVTKKGKIVSFDYKVDGNLTKKHLRMALVIDERTTSVSRGENKNKELKNSNIVIQQFEIALNAASGKGIITVPELVNSLDQLSLIGLIETADLYIVSGTQMKL